MTQIFVIAFRPMISKREHEERWEEEIDPADEDDVVSAQTRDIHEHISSDSAK